MSLFDWFFPEQAQATYLRQMAQSKTRSRGVSRLRQRSVDKRIDELEEDLGYMALVLGSVLQKIDEKGLVTREELKATISELDGIDGVKDGKLDISVLKGLGN